MIKFQAEQLNGSGLLIIITKLWIIFRSRISPRNHNQRYQARVGLPGYEGSPCGIPRGLGIGASMLIFLGVMFVSETFRKIRNTEAQANSLCYNV